MVWIYVLSTVNVTDNFSWNPIEMSLLADNVRSQKKVWFDSLVAPQDHWVFDLIFL